MNTVGTTTELEEMYSVLRAEAARRNIPARLLTTQTKYEGERLVVIPVALDGMTDIVERADALGDIEEAWNYREPPPFLRVFLLPAKAPIYD
jgi:hypothetical protein